MANRPKDNGLPDLENRIRAHIRAVMAENRIRLPALAKELDEDRSALWDMLKDGGRAPSLWVVYRLQVKYNITAHELFNEKPEAKYFAPGLPVMLPAGKYAPKRTPTPRLRCFRGDGPSPEGPAHLDGIHYGPVERRGNVVWLRFRPDRG